MADRTMSEVEAVEAAAEDRAEETGALSTHNSHTHSQSLSEPEKEENKEEEGREKTSAAAAAAIVTLEAKRGEKSDFSRVLTLRACERRVALYCTAL